MTYQIDENGFYGQFGGAYIPEILYKTVEELKLAYLPILESAEFKKEYYDLLKDYVGRPSPLYYAKRMSEKYGCQLYLKREDLNHTGAHKINNALGQILLAKKMGKTRIIAETGAGQHGVATATACALMNMPCTVYQGALDVERQHVNVERMKMLGATVVPVHSGNKTLKDATNEAIRDWCCHPEDTFYIIGSTVGPHPYPDMVARLQSVISEEIKWQLEEKVGRLVWEAEATPLAPSTTTLTTNVSTSSSEKPEVTARTRLRRRQASKWAQWAFSTAAASSSCRQRTDKSSSHTPSPPASTTLAQDLYTATSTTRDELRCSPLTTTRL